MTSLLTLLVGSHFVPPAKALLSNLPRGISLLLEHDPGNPYDENAVKVLLWPAAIPAMVYEELELALPGMGSSLEEVLASPEGLMLGHLAKSGGGPLLKYLAAQGGDLVGNVEFLEVMRETETSGEGYSAKLEFDGAGNPMVSLEASGS